MKTNELARAAKISVATVRRWLREGRLQEPEKDIKGWRLWTEADVVACQALIVKLHRGRPSPHPRATAAGRKRSAK